MATCLQLIYHFTEDYNKRAKVIGPYFTFEEREVSLFYNQK